MKINNVINDKYIQAWGNKKQFIAVHYLGVDGQNNKILSGGYGAHFYVYWDGTIYQACSYDAVPWQVGTGGYYTQLHPQANNYNCIGIEMCVHCDGNANNPQDPKWWFTEETQLATVELVRDLMNKFNIPIQNVLRHGDVVNKHCPAPYLNNNKYRTSWTWNEFKSKLTQSQSQSQPQEDFKAIGTATCTGNSVNVRIAPNGTIIGKLNKGNRFEIDGKIEGGWQHINVHGIGVGYMAKQYIQIDSSTSISTYKISTGDKGLITTVNLNVRNLPNGDVVDTIPEGTSLYPKKRTVGGDFEHYWFEIDKGWVCGGSFLYGWLKDENNRWWYIENGNAIYNNWKTIDKKDYYFGDDGYLVTNSYIKSKNNNKFWWVDVNGICDINSTIDLTKYNVVNE